MGTNPVESPFILIGQILTIFYFLCIPLNYLFYKNWDYLIFKK